MSVCVAYYFAYAASRPKKPPAAIVRQSLFVRRFADAQGLEVAERFMAVLTNRDRHFADTGEFRTAVQRSKTLGVPLVLGDVEDMLIRTDPTLIEDCVSILLGAGMSILDARTGHPVNHTTFRAIFTIARREAMRRRDSIDLGFAINKPERQASASNQLKAAHGAVLAANKRAEKLRTTVDEIRSSLPVGTKLTATLLAKEFNARSILTDGGKRWSRNTAGRLLERLKRS